MKETVGLDVYVGSGDDTFKYRARFFRASASDAENDDSTSLSLQPLFQSASFFVVLCEFSFAWNAALVPGRTAPAPHSITYKEHACLERCCGCSPSVAPAWRSGSKLSAGVLHPKAAQRFAGCCAAHLKAPARTSPELSASTPGSPVWVAAVDVGVSQSHKEIPPQAGFSVWAHVERVERDAILTDPFRCTERTPSSLAHLAGLLLPLHAPSFELAVHSSVSSRCISACTFVVHLQAY